MENDVLGDLEKAFTAARRCGALCVDSHVFDDDRGGRMELLIAFSSADHGEPRGIPLDDPKHAALVYAMGRALSGPLYAQRDGEVSLCQA
ncbi:MAG TPA: hypothetical protein PK513_08100 [Alphaproteobacteria bacterium]|nr:hypothetical protein [Alphaproteobacteria bacterium]USO05842.1 MAG: hypothetical protein H6859_01155 [Rhodospirillales bacterium]HOO82448.1 hypothetical protein [Alphaproteobacteria bacterium]